MTQINAYLNFNGNCREAMNFYKECLGGELTLQTVEGTPMDAKCPPAMKNQVLHSTLIKNGTVLLMGSDMNGPEGFTRGTNVSLSVNCSSEEEINEFFSKLSASGKTLEPLKEQFWGAIFGALTDKFGVRWMFNYDKKEKTQNKAAAVNASHN
jgi:PhnB protein